MDLDLRKLRYFAAVARHRHFGRAAQQLFIAQPVLSRQIRALEQELGCELLTRTTRSVQLTPAGQQLAAEADALFATVDAVLRRVREVDQGSARLTVAFAAGLRVSRALRPYRCGHPGVEVDLVAVDWWEPDAPLRDGRAHVGYLRRPFDETGLHVSTVATEPRTVCLPLGHRLARRRTVSMSDLADEDVLDSAARRTSTAEQKFELVAAGHAVAVVPRSVARAYARDDIVRVRITDAPLVEICLVVAASERRPHVLNFLTVATGELADTREPLRAVD